MGKHKQPVDIARRRFMGQGAIVFACTTGGGLNILTMNSSQAQTLAASPRPIGPAQLDTWLSFDTDGVVTAFFGKMDMGQGVDTAIAQVVAEELDLDVSLVNVVMGDTHRTANQGGASGSSGCRQGANALRNAAAEARRVLLERAAAVLGQPAGSLTVSNGVVSAANASRRISYADLVADGLDTELDWNGNFGNGLNVFGQAQPKQVADYSVVGTSVPRKDIPGKIMATTEYCHHVVLPGMVHARAVRPPVANQVPVAVDESSIAGIESARVVRLGDFVAVVADTEWAAIRASRELVVTWSQADDPFPPMAQLFDHIENSPATGNSATGGFGGQPYETAPTLSAIANADSRLEASYFVPFQSHARMGPSLGVANVKDGYAEIYSDTQKPHDTRNGIAQILGIDPEQVRVIWKPGPGSYGRSDADEAAYEAALLSQHLGQPVRMQWMRHEGHAWDPKAPPCVINCRAGIGQDNAINAWYFHAKGMSGWDVWFNASEPKDTLVGQLTGYEREGRHNFGAPTESYEFPNSVAYWETIAPLQEKASPLRTSHMRAPQEPQVHFAHESFIDEVAVATGQDPIALRLQHLTNDRERAVLEAVAELAGWETQPAPQSKRSGELLTGRGVSLATAFGGYVATVCDVEVEPSTGRVWARRFYVAHDCGLIINPKSLRTTIEGNIVHGLSRTLFEEVRFDEEMVRSVDWLSYPILDIRDAPESIEILTLNRPDLPPGGAGEPSHVTVPAAVANAVFNATGVRIRRLPLSPEYVRQALA